MKKTIKNAPLSPQKSQQKSNNKTSSNHIQQNKTKNSLSIKSPKNANKSSPSPPRSPHTPKYISPFFFLPFPQLFTKHIKNPVNILQSLNQSHLPQKCLQHNINYSLYCQTDHKVLCSRCMYQNNVHKLHTVKPLTQALDKLAVDCQKYSKQLDQSIKKLQQFVAYTNQQLQRINLTYPPAKDLLQSIFKNLHQLLFDIQNQSMRDLRGYKDMLLEQESLRCKQIKNVLAYVEQKKNKYKNKTQGQQNSGKEDKLLVKRNVFAVLSKAANVTQEGLKIDLDQKVDKYLFQNNIMEKVKQFFSDNFQKWMPWGKLKKVQKVKEQKSVSKQNGKNNKKIKVIKNEQKPQKPQKPTKKVQQIQQRNNKAVQNSKPLQLFQTERKLPSNQNSKSFSRKISIDSPPNKIRIRSKSRSRSRSKSITSKLKPQLMKKNSLLLIQPITATGAEQNSKNKLKLFSTQNKRNNSNDNKNLNQLKTKNKNISKSASNLTKNKQSVNLNQYLRQVKDNKNESKIIDVNKNKSKSKNKSQNKSKTQMSNSRSQRKIKSSKEQVIINRNNKNNISDQEQIKQQAKQKLVQQRKFNDFKQ